MLILSVIISLAAVHGAMNAQSCGTSNFLSDAQLAAISLSISVRTSSSFASAFSHADS